MGEHGNGNGIADCEPWSSSELENCWLSEAAYWTSTELGQTLVNYERMGANSRQERFIGLSNRRVGAGKKGERR
jgi:hypothetical protein